MPFPLGQKHSEETKRKISKSNKGKHSHRGNRNPMFGKHHSDETIRKMSEAKLGKHFPKLKEARKGKTPRLGKPCSDEEKVKHSRYKKQWWKRHPEKRIEQSKMMRDRRIRQEELKKTEFARSNFPHLFDDFKPVDVQLVREQIEAKWQPKNEHERRLLREG